MKQGILITFEGGEGCGKSTHSNAFCNYLQKRGYKVLHTREPGGTPLSEEIRKLVKDPQYLNKTAETELLLFEAARAEICKEILFPALKEGNIVVLDRFFDSTTAYQGYGRGLNIEVVNTLNKFATKGLTPDMTIYLSIDPEVAFRRKGGAEQNDAMELQSMEFHERVKKGFDEIAKENADRFVVIKSDDEMESVQAQIIQVFEERYGENKDIQTNAIISRHN